MREDMGKVLVERPRVGSSKRRFRAKGYRQTLARDVAAERERPREPITALRGDTTHFNEHLAPLRRLLDARVGRMWDAVYAELCEHVDRGNVVQKHILTHLFEYVETDARLIDGVPCYPPHRRRGWSWYDGEIRGRYQWYVCPKTGILRRAKAMTKAEERARRNPASPKPALVWVGKYELCRQRPDGGWELLTMRPLRPSPDALPAQATQLDEATGRWICRGMAVELYGRPMFSVGVRPLTAAEVKHLPIPIDLLRPPLKAPNVVR